MPDSPSDKEDSRTASVGQQRNRSNHSSRHTSNEPPSKRQRRNRNGNQTPDVQDFVPQGATFSANSLDVAHDSTSSSGSDSSEDSDDSHVDQSPVNNQLQKPNSGSVPVVNWNKGNKSTIRTSLSSRRINSNSVDKNSQVAASQFEAVNGAYWRSRSASASSGDEKRNNRPQNESDNNDDDSNHMEEGEVNDDESSAESSRSHDSGDSDDSESLDSEADDSIMLNIGSRETQNQIRAISPSDDDDDSGGSSNNQDDDYDPEALPLSRGPAGEGTTVGGKNGTVDSSLTPTSKEMALNLFVKKYPTAPAVLADLEQADMEMQARVIFYSKDINEINLQLPITCTECLREGHLAEVCPMKECVHCGTWNQHQSSFCPKWRRCQRCRERGHDGQQCTSALKGSASEIPCDLCGSPQHLELDCDFMWKLPRQDVTAVPVLVSISCAHCTSTHHLVGDCPSLTRPLASSTWTLRGIDPNIITNMNSVVNPRKGIGASGYGGQRGMKIRGRADPSSPSPDSDDMISRRPPPIGRGGNRGHIRFGNGIGKNKNLGPPPPGSPNYRDREDFSRINGRQRSLSPRPRPGRGRGKDSYQPPPRSPPGRRLGPRGGGERGSRGGRGSRSGGGRGRGGNEEGYRPLPSAARKAWDTYRLG